MFLMRRQPAGKTTPTLINASAAFIVFKRYLSPQYLNASTCRQGINVGVIKRLTVRHLTIELRVVIHRIRTTGTYVDVQGQLMWLDSDISSSAGGSLIKDVSSKAYALSVEIGHRIALSETTRLIPQGQLSWGRVDGDSFTDTGSTTVDPGSNDTTTGRLGLAYEYVADEATFYGIGNIVHDFGGDSTVDAGAASLSADV